MTEIEAMIKTLRYAGYEVMTRRQAMELEARLDRALSQTEEMRAYAEKLVAKVAELSAITNTAPSNNGFHLTGELAGLQPEFGFGEIAPEPPAGEPNR
jgi:hypothetical protein